MSSYCLECRKNRENKNPKFARSKNGKITPFFSQNVQSVKLKNQNLSNNKKLVDY